MDEKEIQRLTRRKFLKLCGVGIAASAVVPMLGFTGVNHKKISNSSTLKEYSTNTKIAELKRLLNKKRNEIRGIKRAIVAKRQLGEKVGPLHSLLRKKQSNMRHYHIAYCELLGTSRARIEHPRKGNLPNAFMINQIKKRYS